MAASEEVPAAAAAAEEPSFSSSGPAAGVANSDVELPSGGTSGGAEASSFPARQRPGRTSSKLSSELGFRSGPGSFRRSVSYFSHISQSGACGSAVALSLVDTNISRPVDLAAERGKIAPRDRPPTLLFGAVVLLFALYFDTAVALWNQYYKGVQRSGTGEACEVLWGKVSDGLMYSYTPPPPECSQSSEKELFKCLRAWQTCSDVRGEVLAKVADNLQVKILGSHICDSPALAKARCESRIDEIYTTNGYELMHSFAKRPEIRRARWRDLCPRKCGACEAPPHAGPNASNATRAAAPSRAAPAPPSLEPQGEGPQAQLDRLVNRAGGALPSFSAALSDNVSASDAASLELGPQAQLDRLVNRDGAGLHSFSAMLSDNASASDAASLERARIRRLVTTPAEIALRRWPSGDWEAGLEGPWKWNTDLVKLSPEDARPGEAFFDRSLQHPDCSWYLVQVNESMRRHYVWGDKEMESCGKGMATKEDCKNNLQCRWFDKAPLNEKQPGCYFKECRTIEGGRCFVRKIHAYTKGASLFVQSVIGIVLYWGIAYCIGGVPMVRACFNFKKMMEFAVVGILFGYASVFAFLAQANLTPGSYLVIGQTSIIVVPTAWRIIFRTPIPMLTWLHIVMTAGGIMIYFLSELDGESAGREDSAIGIVYIFLKVLMNGTAAVTSELYLKSRTEIPFVVQVSYVLPFKTLACLSTIFILPPHRLPPPDVRPGWMMHDWSMFVVFIIFHSLGDTVLSAFVTKVFDSVVLAILGVIGIIFPTWIVSYMLGWEDIDFGSHQGQLKVCGAAVVVFSAMAYVLSRSQAKQLTAKDEEVARLQKAQEEARLKIFSAKAEAVAAAAAAAAAASGIGGVSRARSAWVVEKLSKRARSPAEARSCIELGEIEGGEGDDDGSCDGSSGVKGELEDFEEVSSRGRR